MLFHPSHPELLASSWTAVERNRLPGLLDVDRGLEQPSLAPEVAEEQALRAPSLEADFLGRCGVARRRSSGCPRSPGPPDSILWRRDIHGNPRTLRG